MGAQAQLSQLAAVASSAARIGVAISLAHQCYPNGHPFPGSGKHSYQCVQTDKSGFPLGENDFFVLLAVNCCFAEHKNARSRGEMQNFI